MKSLWRHVPLSEVCDINPKEPGSTNPLDTVTFVPMSAVSDTEGRIAAPVLKPYTEVCDGLFVEYEYLVLCEYKSSVLRSDSKLSGKKNDVLEQIDEKFVVGDSKGRKGVAQFAESIRRILQGDAIMGLEPRKVRMIFPVMICLEHAMLCQGMSGYLNERFDRDNLKTGSTKVTPIFIIDVEHFEEIMPSIRDHNFSALLCDYYQTHMRRGHDQLVPFRRHNIPMLKDAPEGDDHKEKEFRRFFEELGVSLFPDHV